MAQAAEIDEPVQTEEPVKSPRNDGDEPGEDETAPATKQSQSGPRVFQTPDELAAKIRSKFPGAYDKVDTARVVRGWMKKFPVYWQNVNAQNFNKAGIYPYIAPGQASIHAPESLTWRDNLRAMQRVVTEGQLGQTLHGMFPGLTEKLGIAPTETETEQATHRNQLLVPEHLFDADPRNLHPEQPASGLERFTRGALREVGALTTPGNLFMMAIPVTGWATKLSPAAASVISRLVSAGFTVQALHSLYQQWPQFKEALDRGDYGTAAEIAGGGAVNLAMAIPGAYHATFGEGGVPSRDQAKKVLKQYEQASKAQFKGYQGKYRQGPRITPEGQAAIDAAAAREYREQQAAQRKAEGGKPTTLVRGRAPGTEGERAGFAASRQEQGETGREARARVTEADDRAFAGYQLLQSSPPGTQLVDSRGNLWRVSKDWLSRVDANGKETGERHPVASREANRIAGELQPQDRVQVQAARQERRRARAAARPGISEPPSPTAQPGETPFGAALRQALGSPQQPRPAQGPQFEPGIEAVGEAAGQAAATTPMPTLEGIVENFAHGRMMTPQELRADIEGRHPIRRTPDETAWLYNYKRMLGEPTQGPPPAPPDTEFGAKLKQALAQPVRPKPAAPEAPTPPRVQAVAEGVQRAAETSHPPTLEQRVWQLAQERNMDPASLAEDIQRKHPIRRSQQEKEWLQLYKQWTGSTGLDEPPAPTPAPKGPEPKGPEPTMEGARDAGTPPPGPTPAPAAEPTVEGEGGRETPEPGEEPPATPTEASPSEEEPPVAETVPEPTGPYAKFELARRLVKTIRDRARGKLRAENPDKTDEQIKDMYAPIHDEATPEELRQIGDAVGSRPEHMSGNWRYLLGDLDKAENNARDRGPDEPGQEKPSEQEVTDFTQQIDNAAMTSGEGVKHTPIPMRPGMKQDEAISNVKAALKKLGWKNKEGSSEFKKEGVKLWVYRDYGPTRNEHRPTISVDAESAKQRLAKQPKTTATSRPGPAQIEEPPTPSGPAATAPTEAPKPVSVEATGPEGELDKAKNKLAAAIHAWQQVPQNRRMLRKRAQAAVDAARVEVGKAQAAVDAMPKKPAELGRSRTLGSPDEPLYWPEEDQNVYFKDGSWYTQDPETGEWAKAPPDKHNELIFALKSKKLLDKRPAATGEEESSPRGAGSAENAIRFIRAGRPKREKLITTLQRAIQENQGEDGIYKDTRGNVIATGYFLESDISGNRFTADALKRVKKLLKRAQEIEQEQTTEEQRLVQEAKRRRAVAPKIEEPPAPVEEPVSASEAQDMLRKIKLGTYIPKDVAQKIGAVIGLRPNQVQNMLRTQVEEKLKAAVAKETRAKPKIEEPPAPTPEAAAAPATEPGLGDDLRRRLAAATTSEELDAIREDYLAAEPAPIPRGEWTNLMVGAKQRIQQQRWRPGEPEPIAETPSMPAGKGFRTAKGSTYQVHEDGTTTRNKAQRPEHGADQGTQPRSEATLYVTKEDLNKLGEFQTAGPRRRMRVVGKQIGVQYLEGRSKGKIEKRTWVTASDQPAVGLYPVEMWDNGTKVHFGNEITQVSEGPAPEGPKRPGPAKIEEPPAPTEEPPTTQAGPARRAMDLWKKRSLTGTVDDATIQAIAEALKMPIEQVRNTKRGTIDDLLKEAVGEEARAAVQPVAPAPEPRIPNPVADRRQWMRMGDKPFTAEEELAQRRSMMAPPPRNNTRVAPTQHTMTYLSGYHNNDLLDLAQDRGDIGLMLTPTKPEYLDAAENYPVVGVDNGAFGANGFNEDKFVSMVEKIADNPNLKRKVRFVVAPDVPMNAAETLKQFGHWADWLHKEGLPVALAAQNGMESMDIPWDDVDVLFLGGDTDWKIGRRAHGSDDPFYAMLRKAYEEGLPIHMGRVNSAERLEMAGYGLGATTADGTFLKHGPDANKPRVERWLNAENGRPQPKPEPAGSPEEPAAAPTPTRAGPAQIEAPPVPTPAGTMTPEEYAAAQKEQNALSLQVRDARGDEYGKLANRLHRLNDRIAAHETAVRYASANEVKPSEPVDMTGDKYKKAGDYYRKALETLKKKWIAQARAEYPDDKRGDGELWANMVSMKYKPGGNLADHPNGQARIEVPGDGKFLVYTRPENIEAALKGAGAAFKKPAGLPKGGTAVPKAPKEFDVDAYLAQLDAERKELLARQSSGTDAEKAQVEEELKANEENRRNALAGGEEGKAPKGEKGETVQRAERLRPITALKLKRNEAFDVGRGIYHPGGNKQIVSDGHVAVRLDKATIDSPKANKWKQQLGGYSAGKDVDQKFDDLVGKAGKNREPLEFLGHQLESDNVGDIGYMVDPKGTVYGVNPHKMQLFRELYGDDVAFEGGDPKAPIVVTKNGDPVGVIMPVGIDKVGIDLPTARRTMAIRGKGPQKDVGLGARARRRARAEEETQLEEPPSPGVARENQPDLFERPLRSAWEQAVREPYRNMPGQPRGPASAQPPRGAQRQQAAATEPPVSDEELMAYTGPGLPDRDHPLREKVKEFRETIAGANKWVRKQIALATLDPDARQMALHERTRLSELATMEAKFHHELSKARPALNRLGPQGRVAFLIAAEGGRKFENSELQAFADTWREIQDDLWRDVMNRSGIRKYIDNYWAHYWQDTSAGKAVGDNWVAKRTLEGRKEYLKKRDYPTIEEGIAAGLKLATDDPIEMQMRKIRSMLQFITGDDVVETIKELGQAQYSFGSAGRQKHIDPTWDKLPAPWGDVFGPKDLTIHEAVDANLFKGLNDFARSLGILHMREEPLGGEGLAGWYDPASGEVVTKIATPIGTLTHEIGHALDFQYGPQGQTIWETMQKIPGVRGERIRRELKKLADMRFAGAEDRASATYKKYVRKGTEKMANMFDAFVNMPWLFDPNHPDSVAPETGQWLKGYLASNPKLRPLLNVKPSLVRTSITHNLPTGEMELKGSWYAPKSAVEILKRSMSAGLSENPAAKTFRFATNSMVAGRLAFSGRHMLFTAFEPMASQLARGIKQISQGRFKAGAISMAKGATPWATTEAFLKGNKAFKDFYGAGIDGIENQQIVKDITAGGGRFQQDPWYVTRGIEKFRNRWQQGEPFKAIGLHGLGAAVDAVAWPTMRWWVPRMKLGIFLENAGEEMHNNPFTVNDVMRFGKHYFESFRGANADANAEYAKEVANAIHNGYEPERPEGMDERTAERIEERVGRVYQHSRQMKKRETLQNVWDSVDNRLGQIVYDNLFWDRALKETAQSMVTSVGWNLGFFKEFGGGFIDLAKWATGKKALSMKASYTMAYGITLGMMGLLYQFIKTGRTPKTAKDWWTDPFFPHNGDGDERVNLPSYINDFYRYGRGYQYGLGEGLRESGAELASKITPVFSTARQLAANRDFYGVQIYNPEDPKTKEALDIVNYGWHAYWPYSLTNVNRLAEATGKPLGPSEYTEAFLGINKAPSSLAETGMEHLMREYAGQFRPEGAMSKEEHQRLQQRKQFAERLKLGDPTVNEQIRQGIAARTLKPGDWEAIHEMSRNPWWINTAKRLSLTQILHAWEQATPEEKRILAPILRSKGSQLPSDWNDPMWQRWRGVLQEMQNLGPAPAPGPIATPMTSLTPPPAP